MLTVLFVKGHASIASGPTSFSHRTQRRHHQNSDITVLSAGSDKYFDDKDGGGAVGAEGEMYPYVSFSISIDS